MHHASRSLESVLLLVLAVTCALSIVANAEAADAQRQEQIALAWIEAHNSGDVEKMAAHREDHRVNPGGDWRDQFAELVDRLGTLDVMSVTVEHMGVINFVAESSEGGMIKIEFQFSKDSPDRIDKNLLERGERERESSLPLLTLSLGDPTRTSSVIDGYLKDRVEEDVFSGVVLIGSGEEVTYEGAFGLANREFGIANALSTRFDIGSITKDFTRVAVAQLIAAGKIGIDDPVGKHLPTYPNEEARERATVRHLFEHRSGIGDYFTEEWSKTPMGSLRNHQDYIDVWGSKPLNFEPGSRREYSNFGFTVLGAIVEAASGMSYFDYVVENVFVPAGMTDSGFFETDAVVPRVATGYTFYERGGNRGTQLRKNIYLEPAKGGPWGKTFCTARDLFRFWNALANHRLTPPNFTPWVLLEGPPPAPGSEPASTGTVRDVGLGGGGPGLSAELEASDGQVIIVLSNLDPPSARNVAKRLRQAFDEASKPTDVPE